MGIMERKIRTIRKRITRLSGRAIVGALFISLLASPSWALTGDVDDVWGVNLRDTITSLRICSGMSVNVNLEGDVNNDGKIGLEEAIYILRLLAGMLPQGTDSVQVICMYGTKAVILFQGSPNDPGVEGPYNTTLPDYANEVIAVRTYAFDSQGDLLAVFTNRGTYSDGIVSIDANTGTGDEVECAPGYTCYAEPESDVVWVMKNDGNVNGPTCKQVCESALSQNYTYYACDQGRTVVHTDVAGFETVAAGLGFTCRKGGCWDGNSFQGLILVSIATAADGSKRCYFPPETEHSCTSHPGNANCYGERYSTVCPCVPKKLDEACEWDCPPNNPSVAVWETGGTSCLERINYWRKRACEEGWVECPPAGLPPMVECIECHECANSEAAYDKVNGSHSSFGRCGESSQGEGGGATCADVIDGFISERAPDANGIMRCAGHCGPILKDGCQTFHWGKDKNSGFHVLNWRSCNSEKCQTYCDENPGDCYTHDTSPSTDCR